MKLYIKRIFAFILAISVFLSCTVSVYAFPARLKDGTWIDKPWSEAGEEIWLTIQYGLSQIGVFFQNGADFKQWLKNTEAYQDLWDENGRLAKHVTIDTKTETIKYDKEIMSVLKSAADDYAKDNEPYFIVRIPSYKEVNAERFATKGQYLTICNLAKKYGLIGVNGLYMSDLSEILNGNYSYVNDIGTLTEESLLTDYFVNVFDDSWVKYKGSQRYKFDFSAGTSVGYEAIEDGTPTGTNISFDYQNQFYIDYITKHNGVVLDFGTPTYQYECIRACLISRDGIRTRVFKSLNDFKNYSVGNRKVYYTKDYYDYEPDDLSASVDDLEKSVDELQKIIDELLKKIDDLTSESDIEDLLKQILDALKNQQGTGGGGSGGGGDVVVDVDLTETNGWLSKIYEKVTQIFDKISKTAEGVSDSVHAKIQETLDEMLKVLKSIRRWTIADTAVNAADAVADWLDFLKSLFDDVENGAGNAVAAISTSMDGATGLLKTKFPFCIPWDVAFLVTFLAHEPETPVFKLPIHVESAGIDECIEVDMSDFSGISTISRTLLMLIYCYGLLNLTMKIIPMAKEGT